MTKEENGGSHQGEDPGVDIVHTEIQVGSPPIRRRKRWWTHPDVMREINKHRGEHAVAARPTPEGDVEMIIAKDPNHLKELAIGVGAAIAGGVGVTTWILFRRHNKERKGKGTPSRKRKR